MERLNDNQTPRGLTASGIRNWGYLFILLGIVAKCLIQNGLLGIDGMTAQQLLALMEQSEQSMMLVTASIVMQALESMDIETIETDVNGNTNIAQIFSDIVNGVIEEMNSQNGMNHGGSGGGSGGGGGGGTGKGPGPTGVSGDHCDRY